MWKKQQNRIEGRIEKLNRMDYQEDEDRITLEKAYESLLEAYQESRALNDELMEMVREYQ